MNKKAQTVGVKGFALITALMIFLLGLFALIEPFKENLDDNRGDSSLNCPGTPGFNQTSYDAQTTHQKLQKRPVCFVTGLSFVWFMGAFIIASFVWLSRNWK